MTTVFHPVQVAVDENSTPVSVTAAAGAAGTSIGLTTKTFKIHLSNRSDVSAPIEFKVGSGSWQRLDPGNGVDVAVDLSTTTVVTRKTGLGVDVPLVVTTFTSGNLQARSTDLGVSTTGGGSATERVAPSLAISASGYNDAYTAWPYGCLFFDSAINQFVQLYSRGISHYELNHRVYVRKRSVGRELTWGAEVKVADRTGASTTTHCRGANKMPNGNYVAVCWEATAVGGAPTAAPYYTSSDQGATWTNAGNMKAVGGADLPVGEPMNLFVTKAGTVLSWLKIYTGTAWKLLRSTNSAANWSQIDVTLSASASTYTPTEPQFAQLPSGRIICLLRCDGVSITQGGSRYPALFTYSDDDGQTWAPITVSSITDMTSNNCAMLVDGSRVRVWAASRYPDPYDALGSMYAYDTTFARAAVGDFGLSTRIFQGFADQKGSPHFGYPAAAADSSGNRLITWYDGDESSAAIYEMTEVDGVSAGAFSGPRRDGRSTVLKDGSANYTLPKSGGDFTIDAGVLMPLFIPVDCAVGAKWRIYLYGSNGAAIAFTRGDTIIRGFGLTNGGASTVTLASTQRFAVIEIECVAAGYGFAISNVQGTWSGLPSTVSALQTASAANRGARTFVTDSNATMASNYGAVVAGGGANVVPVFSDGASWRIG